MNKKEIGKNVCLSCKNNCCKLGGAEFTKKDVQRVLNAGYPNHFRIINENHYETMTKNGACAYMGKDNLCTIQKIKPKMCWAWPVYSDFKKDKKVFYLMNCPLAKHLSKKDIAKMKKQVSGYTKEFIFCSETQMSSNEVKNVMKRFNKFKKIKLK